MGSRNSPVGARVDRARSAIRTAGPTKVLGRVNYCPPLLRRNGVSYPTVLLTLTVLHQQTAHTDLRKVTTMMVARRGLTLLATAAFAAALLGASSTASAASIPASPSMSASAAHYGEFWNWVDEPGGNVHSCASNTCSSVPTPVGTDVYDYCYVGGQPLAGTRSWDYVTIKSGPYTGHSGWIHEHWLFNEGQLTPCWH